METPHFITHLDVRKFLISTIGWWSALKIMPKGIRIRLALREMGKAGQQQDFQMYPAGLF